MVPTLRLLAVAASFAALRCPPTVLAFSAVTSRDEKVREVLSFARSIGPVGALSSDDDQQKLLTMARELAEDSDPMPARHPLRGTFHLVYSAHPGRPSGRLFGPFYGQVTQIFLDDGETYINQAKFGPLVTTFRALKSTKDDLTNEVNFNLATIKLFGRRLVQRHVDLRGGEWHYVFLGTVLDEDGQKKLIRVMETPRLFILEQPVSSQSEEEGNGR